MVGLPDLIGALGFPAVEQIIGFAVGLLAIKDKSREGIRNGADNIVDGVIAGRFLLLCLGDAADFPIDSS